MDGIGLLIKYLKLSIILYKKGDPAVNTNNSEYKEIKAKVHAKNKLSKSAILIKEMKPFIKNNGFLINDGYTIHDKTDTELYTTLKNLNIPKEISYEFMIDQLNPQSYSFYLILKVHANYKINGLNKIISKRVRFYRGDGQKYNQFLFDINDENVLKYCGLYPIDPNEYFKIHQKAQKLLQQKQDLKNRLDKINKELDPIEFIVLEDI
jgi:hypothetical protein